MRLKKDQKEKLLEWIAQGIRTDEINKRAQELVDPFEVSRGQVEYYRRSRRQVLKKLLKIAEEGALNAGLALKAERVRKLKMLAKLMEDDLFGGFLWTEEVKVVGSGESAEVVDFEKFNTAEVEQFRGVLDDIAKEMGERNNKMEIDVPRHTMRAFVELVKVVYESKKGSA